MTRFAVAGGGADPRQQAGRVEVITRAVSRLSLEEAQPTVEGQPAAAAPVRRPAARGLESLEERIDDCLTLARSLDRDGLEAVIDLLRKARNGVVVQQGQ